MCKFLVFFVFLGASWVHGATISAVATGASNSAYPNGGTTLTYYYSHIGSTVSSSYIQPAAHGDSCDTTKNLNCRNKTDSLTFTFSTDATGGSVKIVADDEAISSSNTDIATGLAGSTTYTQNVEGTVSVTFAAICTAAAAAGHTTVDANCDVSTATSAATIQLSVVVDVGDDGSYTDGTDAVVTLPLIIKSAIPEAPGVSGNEGLTAFTVVPGDEKVYFKDITIATTSPSSLNEIGVQYARFFYSQGSSTFDFPSVGTVSVNDGDASFQTTVETLDDGSGGISDNQLTGLTNDVWYYFRSALVDYAGNVGYVDNTTDHYGLPSLTIGLLTEQSDCFVATAAYGTNLDGHVDTLRSFRDQVLSKTPLGQKIINWYYAHSPKLAAVIQENPLLKIITQGALYPLVGFSWLSLHVGAFNASILLAIILMLPLLMIRVHQAKRRNLTS